MRYGMVSSPVLGCDLALHPAGPRVAAVLRGALAADAATVGALAAAAVPRPRGRAAADGARPPGVPRPSSAVPPAVPASAAGRLGDLDAVLAYVRDQVLGEQWSRVGPLHRFEHQPLLLAGATREAAARLLADAVADAWAAPVDAHLLEVADRPTGTVPAASAPAGADPSLRRAWDGRGGPRPPAAVDCGDGDPLLAAALDRVALLTREDARRLSAVGADRRDRLGAGAWAREVHEASWALHAHGRTEAAACRQLDAVVALGRTPVRPDDLAGGGWLVVAGALHALAADGPAALDGPLVAAWVEALGAPPGPGSP